MTYRLNINTPETVDPAAGPVLAESADFYVRPGPAGPATIIDGVLVRDERDEHYEIVAKFDGQVQGMGLVFSNALSFMHQCQQALDQYRALVGMGQEAAQASAPSLLDGEGIDPELFEQLMLGKSDDEDTRH